MAEIRFQTYSAASASNNLTAIFMAKEIHLTDKTFKYVEDHECSFLLNLLKELRKRDKIRGLPSIFSFSQ